MERSSTLEQIIEATITLPVLTEISGRVIDLDEATVAIAHLLDDLMAGPRT